MLMDRRAVGDSEAASSEGCAWVEYEEAAEKTLGPLAFVSLSGLWAIRVTLSDPGSGTMTGRPGRGEGPESLTKQSLGC